jgi:branched-subunit amino acid aminotransferase/4-amino-4-deoxychorismate lyase
LRSVTSDIVTRLAAELGFPVESRRVRREDLHTGTVVFAGTLLGVRRVRELDGVDRSAAGSWHSADLLVVAYRDLCAGRPELAKDLFTELAGGA